MQRAFFAALLLLSLRAMPAAATAGKRNRGAAGRWRDRGRLIRADRDRRRGCPDEPRSREEGDPRIVFAFTTMKKRLSKVRPVLDAVVEGQRRAPDAVYLALPPDVEELPTWLSEYNATSCRPGLLRILRMQADYGPASKLLAALREGGERDPRTVVVYGDDDIVYSPELIEQHLRAQRGASGPTAFGSRLISAGRDSGKKVLEAVGTISVPAGAVPDAVFGLTISGRSAKMADVCRYSDDFWISYHLAAAGVALRLLPDCQYNFNSGSWPAGCGSPTFREIGEIAHTEALSAMTIGADGTVSRGGGGDWRDQLGRYEACQRVIEGTQD